MAPAHITDEQVAEFRTRTLSPAELLELDRHIAACAPCRDRLYADQHASNRIRAIRADVSGHLDYDRIVKCSEGGAGPEERAHLKDCPMCRAEVQDLSRFRTELHDTPRAPRKAPVVSIATGRRWPVPVGIAAAVLLVAGGAFWATRRQPAPVATVATARPAQEEAPLPPADRELLDRTVAADRLERAPVLDHLISKPGTLLGPGAATPAMSLLSPVGTTVLTDRPLLRWTPLSGATAYTVAIFDEQFNPIAESPSRTTTDWRPEKPLPRDRVLTWQVTATTARGTIRAPKPPAPEARFQVVAKEVAAHIETVRQQHPNNALLLAALYARAGALDDAELALQAADRSTTQRYRESLAKIRRAE